MGLIKKSKKGSELLERIKLNRAQQSAMIIIGITSAAVGFGVVLAIWFVKYIQFNSKILEKLDTSVSSYSASIKNSGACVAPSAKSGIYTVAELKACDPNTTNIYDVIDSLKYNVIIGLGNSVSLGAVETAANVVCYDDNFDPLPFSYYLGKYQTETDLDKKSDWYNTLITCSPIRIVAEALPTSMNENTYMVSLNKLFKDAGVTPEKLSAAGSSSVNDLGLSTIPVSLELRDDEGGNVSLKVLRNFEKSIRTIDVSKASITMSADGKSLEFSASMYAYYSSPVSYSEKSNTYKYSDMQKGK